MPQRDDPIGASPQTVPDAGPRRSRPGREPRRRRPASLALRITLLTAAVALVVALVAGLVGTALIRNASVAATRRVLADNANIVAAQLGPLPTDQHVDVRHLAAALGTQGIDVVLVTRTGKLTGTPAAIDIARSVGVAKLAPGAALSKQVTTGGRQMLVEARAVNGRVVALIAPADLGAAQQATLQWRILLALLIGVAVAIPGGLILARLVSRPLRRTAAVARSMAAGARQVRAEVTGPSEVADVAASINELADALGHSESRQRQFFASVSHELRTPLAGISGQADALADGLVAPDEMPTVGASIRAEAARLERQVADLLDLARLGADSFRMELLPVDLVQLVAEAASTWRTRCSARAVPLWLELPEHPVPVIADADRLRQVLDGLAENALRLLHPGRPLVFAVFASGDRGLLQVRDGGPGLAAADYPVAFEPGLLHDRYHHVRPAGAGLGLALARGLVTRMGGSIAAAPAAEGGVAMTIMLPLAGALPPAGVDNAVWMAAPPGR